jgi:hypothetical protein
MEPNLHLEHSDVLSGLGKLKVIDPNCEVRHLYIIGVNYGKVLIVKEAKFAVELNGNKDAQKVHGDCYNADVALWEVDIGGEWNEEVFSFTPDDSDELHRGELLVKDAVVASKRQHLRENQLLLLPCFSDLHIFKINFTL